MTSHYILPTITVLDDFFDDPLWVKNYALSLSYAKDTQNQWPGERSELLDVINKDMLGYIVNKFLSLYYDHSNTNIVWHANGSFQKTNKLYKDGWIHTDAELITVIIFLNDDADPTSGTTLYEKKTEIAVAMHTDKKKESFDNTDLIESMEEFRLEHNAQFKESIVIKNKFNRLIAFDSQMFHGANNFDATDERLTLVIFIDRLQVNNYPIQRLKKL